MASTQKFSVNLGLGVVPETGNPELFAEAFRIYTAVKTLAGALDTYTGAVQYDAVLWSVLTPADSIRSQGMNRLYVIYSEAVTLGQVVTLWNDAGVLKAKKAGGAAWAGDTRGYCSVVGGVAIGDYGEVILFGLHPYVAGATPGALYYTSNITAGAITATKPNAHLDNFQPVAFALNATTLFFNPSVFAPILDTTSLAIPVFTP